MKNKVLIPAYCSLLSIVFLLAFSYTTSPIYNETSAADSAIFQIIGKYWAHGYIPYASLWDLKGPIIFFVNCLGYQLTGSVVGVFIIQWICLIITLILMYKLLRTSFNALTSCLLLLLPVISFSANTWGGNCVEEFVLPLMALSYLLIYKWLNEAEHNEAMTHPWKYALIYGMTFSFCLLSRLTNALGLCGAVAVIGIWLMTKGEWKNLGANIIAFLAGVALLLLPFSLYFWSKGALYDMWYGTILYNLEYASATGNDATTIKGTLQLVIRFLDTWMLLIVGLLMIVTSRRKLAGLLWTCVAVFSLAWFVRGYAFAHYGVVSLPLVAVTLVETKELVVYISKSRKRMIFKSKLFACIFPYFIITLASCWHTFSAFRTNYVQNHDLAETRAFMKGVPSSFKKSFIGYNAEIDYYLYDNIKPACRFFALQDFEASQSPSLQKYIMEDFKKNKPKWILVDGHARYILPILKDYHIFKQDISKGLYLYTRK